VDYAHGRGGVIMEDQDFKFNGQVEISLGYGDSFEHDGYYSIDDAIEELKKIKHDYEWQQAIE